MMRLASCHSAACRRISSGSSIRPSTWSGRNRTSGRPRHSSESLNTASVLAHLAQPVDEPLGRPAGGGGFVDQREHHRGPPGGGAEEVLPQAPGVGRQPQPAQLRVPERQLHRLLVIQAEDRRGFQRDDADRHGLGEGPDHHPELLAALDHPEQRLGAAGIDPHGLEPPAEDEADGGEQDVRLVDDAAGRVVGDLPVPHDLLQGLVRHAAEVLVDLQQRDDVIAHGGAFPVRGGCDPRTRPRGRCSRCR